MMDCAHGLSWIKAAFACARVSVFVCRAYVRNVLKKVFHIRTNHWKLDGGEEGHFDGYLFRLVVFGSNKSLVLFFAVRLPCAL